MPNATGKENRYYDTEELEKLRIETTGNGFPSWIPAGFQAQIEARNEEAESPSLGS